MSHAAFLWNESLTLINAAIIQAKKYYNFNHLIIINGGLKTRSSFKIQLQLLLLNMRYKSHLF